MFESLAEKLKKRSMKKSFISRSRSKESVKDNPKAIRKEIGKRIFFMRYDNFFILCPPQA